MGGKIQKEFNLSELLLRYILTDTSGLSPRLAIPLLLKSVKDTQHLYKSKSTSFSNLHTVCFLARYMRGRGCAVICEQSCDFIHPLFAWAPCWWEGIKWYSREYLWASQPKPKILLSETRFLVRGHCSSLGLHPDTRRNLSVKSAESRHHMRHMTCEWLSSHVFAYHHQQQDNSWLCLCSHPICLKLSWATKLHVGNRYFIDCQLFGLLRSVLVKTHRSKDNGILPVNKNLFFVLLIFPLKVQYAKLTASDWNIGESCFTLFFFFSIDKGKRRALHCKLFS